MERPAVMRLCPGCVLMGVPILQSEQGELACSDFAFGNRTCPVSQVELLLQLLPQPLQAGHVGLGCQCDLGHGLQAFVHTLGNYASSSNRLIIHSIAFFASMSIAAYTRGPSIMRGTINPVKGPSTSTRAVIS